MSRANASRAFWDRAARDNAAWYVANGHLTESDEFFRQGREETDFYLHRFGVEPQPTDRVLEIGCGVGRMTRRLAELTGQVTAADVSEVMLERCRANLAGCPGVTFLALPGDGSLGGVADGQVDLVISYITLQHVPTAAAQLRYLIESARVLAPGGRLLVQIRATSPTARVLDWAAHLAHRARGRRTLSRAWRGARLDPCEVTRALTAAGLQVRLEPFGARHTWVVASRPAAPRVPPPRPADADRLADQPSEAAASQGER